jgi:hypothetical protein
LEKQAARDRKNYPDLHSAWDEVSPLLKMILFMVHACGIPFEHAERQAIADIGEKQRVRKDTMFKGLDEEMHPSVAAKHLAHFGVIDALVFARMANQARKGTDGATFWNEVVRELRTGQFSTLQTIERIDQLDREDIEKEVRRQKRERRAVEKASGQALQKPGSD